jgi:RHS repeat-associated protein
VRKNANGNLTEQGSSYTGTEDSLTIAMSEDYRQYRYDLLNRLTEVLRYQDGNLVTVARYGYDINSLRIYKEDGEGKTTRYVYDATGNRLETHSDETSSYYIFRGLRHVARRIVDNASQTEVRHYYGTDHLGSTVLVTGDAGEVLWSGETNPFGDSVSGEGIVGESERIKYTGKDFDEDAGLYYFNARWYDPGTGRFITEDPARDGISWYAYVANNPLRYVDPSGLRRVEDGDPSNGSALIVIEQERDGEMDVVIVDGGDTYHPHDANIIEAVINNDPRYVNDQISMDDIWSIIGVATESDPNLSQRFSQAFIEFSRYAPLAVGLSVANMIRNSSGTASGIPPRGARQIAMEARNFQEQQLLTGNRPVLSDQITNSFTFNANGSTGRTQPANLNEQLAMDQVQSDPQGGRTLQIVDPATLQPGKWLVQPRWLGHNVVRC